jgi:hypothetical protein
LGARLEACHDETGSQRRDFVLDYHELRLLAPPELFSENGRPRERLRGQYLPLRAGQRVLAHCVAGLNRSVTIGCAALILLEGLSAEAALERVREHHPWARPDSHHWLMLRWLAHTSGRSMTPTGEPTHPIRA